MKFNYNYHTHTSRCGHADGEDEEYVIAAIEEGIKVLGFTDHTPLPGLSQPGIRMDYSEFEGYRNSILSLKEKYKDKIEIHLGLECEYYDRYVDYYKDLLSSGKVEYLILGQHCYLNEDNKFCWYLHRPQEISLLRKYVADMIKGMETGLFTYVAHPDLFVTVFDEWNPIIEELAHEICKAAERTDTALEMNVIAKDFRGLGYPLEEFWKIVSKYNIRVYIGLDIHRPSAFITNRHCEAEYLASKYKLKIETKIK